MALWAEKIQILQTFCLSASVDIVLGIIFFSFSK